MVLVASLGHLLIPGLPFLFKDSLPNPISQSCVMDTIGRCVNSIEIKSHQNLKRITYLRLTQCRKLGQAVENHIKKFQLPGL